MDWLQFCDYHRIPYREGGKSSKRGNIYISCPFCGDDSSLMMGLEIGTKRWGCWKNEEHRGPNPWFLIRELLGCSEDEARQLAGEELVDRSLDGLKEKLRSLNVAKTAAVDSHFLEFEIPWQCFQLRQRGKRSRRFLEYLEDRGFPSECVDRYSLLGCDHHPRLAGRLVVPLCDSGSVVGYTARSIVGALQRYHTEPSEAAVACLFNAQNALGGRVLFIVEGPFDSLKLDWAAYEAGYSASAVSLAGLSIKRKLRRLRALSKKYARVVLLLDSTATSQALQMQRSTPFEAEITSLPLGADDPGDLDCGEARRLVKNFL